MKNFKEIGGDDYGVAYERVITGRITRKRYKILSRYARIKTLKRRDLHCHHEYDCCGCLCGQSMDVVFTHNSAKFTFSQTFNY